MNGHLSSRYDNVTTMNNNARAAARAALDQQEADRVAKRLAELDADFRAARANA